MIPASVIAELSRALVGPDDRYRAASVPVDIEPIDFARASSDTHVHIGFFGVPGGFEVATVGAAWQSVASHGEDRHANAWSAMQQLDLPADVFNKVKQSHRVSPLIIVMID